MESAASGLLAAHQLLARLQGGELPPPPAATMCGALLDYITTPNKDFQPMGANTVSYTHLIKQKTTRHPGRSVVQLDFVVGQQLGLIQQEPPLAGGKAAEQRQ